MTGNVRRWCWRTSAVCVWRSRASCCSDEERQIADIVAALVRAGVRVSAVEPRRRNLEQIYLEMSHANGASAAHMTLFLRQLRGELWKLFARKRTYIGFGAFLALEILILLIFQLPKVQRSWRQIIERARLRL